MTKRTPTRGSRLDADSLRGSPFFLKGAGIDWVKKTLSSMDVRRKAAQLFIPFVKDASPAGIRDCLRTSPGGAYLSCDRDTDGLRKAVKALQNRASIPLLIASDIEFNVQGSISDGTHMPGQMGVAATGDPLMAWKQGKIAGREGRFCGITWSFTPVADLNLNHRNPIVNNRSYGSDPRLVLTMCREYVRALQEEGVAACLKHWPGDGTDDRDQHLVTVRNHLEMREWKRTYGRVFKGIIEAGVKTVMSAHITLPAYHWRRHPGVPAEAILPASISRELNVGLLRGEMGFGGLIVSDASYMAGVSSQGPRERIVPMLVENGCDMVLFPFQPELDLELLLKGIESGHPGLDRLDEAVTRVLALKASLGLHESTALIPASRRSKYVSTRQHREWQKQCVEASVTLVKDTQHLLPLCVKKHRRILLFTYRPCIPPWPKEPLIISRLLNEKGFEVTEYSDGVIIDADIFDVFLYLLNEQPSHVNENLDIKWSKMFPSVPLRMYRYWFQCRSLFVSLGNPYHLYEVPASKTFINAYSPIEPVQRFLVEALVGKKPLRGTSPVDPFCGLEEARL